MTKTITRVAVPAHIYITVETLDTYSDEQILAEAKARIAEVEQLRDYLFLKGFVDADEAIAYVNHDLSAEIEDQNW